MPAGDHQREERRAQIRLGEVGRRHMGVDVVDRDQWDAVGKGQRFGKVHADQQRADQAGMRRHGNGADVGEPYAGLVQRLFGDAGDRFDVGAARDLRDHAAVEAVGLDLRGDDVGADGANAVRHLHDRGGRFVAG